MRSTSSGEYSPGISPDDIKEVVKLISHHQQQTYHTLGKKLGLRVTTLFCYTNSTKVEVIQPQTNAIKPLLTPNNALNHVFYATNHLQLNPS